MNNTIKLVPIFIIAAINLIVLTLLAFVFLRGYFYKRLDEPNSLKHLRFLCKVQPVLVILFIIFESIRFLGFLIDPQVFKSPSIFSVIIGCVVIAYSIKEYFRFYRYYLKHRDDNAIIAGWYMKKYFAMKINKDNIAQACEYLHKASEYRSDLVFIWSMMAMFNERYFDKSELADEYLAKAQQILNTSENPSIKDKALFESVTGDVLLCRDNIQEGLAHMKAAFDLDSCTLYKERYEDALKWANGDNEPEEPKSDKS